MFATRVTVSLFHFLLMVVMSGFVIYLTYRTFIRANPDFDMENEIKKGNTAVGLLVGTIIFCASQIMMAGAESSISMFRLHMLAPAEEGASLLKVAGLIAAHLTMSMLLAVVAISVTLRLFGRLTRHMEEGKELQRGNLAVGILLSSVVLVSSLFIRDGVSALAKALTPQPSIGRIQIQH